MLSYKVLVGWKPMPRTHLDHYLSWAKHGFGSFPKVEILNGTFAVFDENCPHGKWMSLSRETRQNEWKKAEERVLTKTWYH